MIQSLRVNTWRLSLVFSVKVERFEYQGFVCFLIDTNIADVTQQSEMDTVIFIFFVGGHAFVDSFVFVANENERGIVCLDKVGDMT